MTAYLFPALAAALAARLLIYCYTVRRSEKRYIARSKTRRQRSLEDLYWSVAREVEAAHARQLQLARLRAETFNHGLHSVKS